MLACLAAPPEQAGAATVKVERGKGGETVAYRAARGERNRLSIRRVRNGHLFTDSGAVIAAGRGCRRLGRHAALCRLPSGSPSPAIFGGQVTASLGNRADRAEIVRSPGFAAAAYFLGLTGGAGNDVLIGGNDAYHPYRVRLVGQKGNDRLLAGATTNICDLRGGPGADLLRSTTSARGCDFYDGPGNDRDRGGPGPDLFFAGLHPNGSDDIHGGGSGDTMIYGPRSGGILPPGRIAPVKVSLDDRRNDGGRGSRERDNVHSDIESLFGGNGDDVIFGSSGPDRLYGNRGRDKIFGLQGNDVLSGFDGARELKDMLDCNNGVDRAEADAADVVTNCEL